jgi:ABC-type lipoprotein release transport system permease subunit
VPEAPTGGLLIRLAPEADRDAATGRLNRMFDGSIAVRPQEVGDVGRVRGAPVLFAVVFALVAAAALAHLLLLCVRRRRRDLAILKTLGFTRGQVQAAVAWLATTVAAVGVVVGVPLGLALGRFGWNMFAEGLGVKAEPVLPVGLSFLVVPGVVLLANVIAALPASAAAATRPAIVLRAE